MKEKNKIRFFISILVLFVFFSYFSGILTSMRYYFSTDLRTNMDVVPTYSITYYIDGQVDSSLTPKTIQQNTTVTLPSPTKSGYVFYGWYRNSSYSGTKITTLSNQTSAVTLYGKFVQLPIIDGVTTATMTQTQAAAYYGKKVSTVNGSAYNPNSNDTRTWRVFYIDTANKYGDGKGAIYLKADEATSKKARFATNIASGNESGWTATFGGTNGVVVAGTSSTVSNNRYYQITNNNVVTSGGTTINTHLLKLNPTYATGRKNLSRIFTQAEKAAAFLCEPAKFSAYKATIASYAIGSPTIEMWIDSWNGVYGTNYKFSYRWNANASATGNGAQQLPGYQLRLNSESWGQAAGSETININNVDTTGMYKSTAGMWYASPAIVYEGRSLQRQSSVGFIGNSTINNEYTFCPVVCLQMTANVLTTTGAASNSKSAVTNSLKSSTPMNVMEKSGIEEDTELKKQFYIELYRGFEETNQMLKENETTEITKTTENIENTEATEMQDVVKKEDYIKEENITVENSEVQNTVTD